MENNSVIDSAYAAMVADINKGVEYPDAEFRAALRVNKQSLKAISVDDATAQLRGMYDCETTQQSLPGRDKPAHFTDRDRTGNTAQDMHGEPQCH